LQQLKQTLKSKDLEIAHAKISFGELIFLIETMFAAETLPEHYFSYFQGICVDNPSIQLQNVSSKK
jgi:hypothetical protein